MPGDASTQKNHMFDKSLIVEFTSCEPTWTITGCKACYAPGVSKGLDGSEWRARTRCSSFARFRGRGYPFGYTPEVFSMIFMEHHKTLQSAPVFRVKGTSVLINYSSLDLCSVSSTVSSTENTDPKVRMWASSIGVNRQNVTKKLVAARSARLYLSEVLVCQKSGTTVSIQN